MKINNLLVRETKERENYRSMTAAILNPIEEREAATLDALEDELLASSEHDESARCSLYLTDLIRDLSIDAEALQGCLPHVSDPSVRRHLQHVVARIEPMISETRRLLAGRVRPTYALELVETAHA